MSRKPSIAHALRVARNEMYKNIKDGNNKSAVNNYVAQCDMNFMFFSEAYQESITTNNQSLSDMQIGALKGKMYAWRDAWKLAINLEQ